MIARILHALILPLIAVLCLAGSAAGQPVSGSQDGLVAEVRIDAGRAAIDWRYVAALPAPLGSLTAGFNGRPLKILETRSYPQAGDVTALLFSVDITGGQLLEEHVFKAKARLLKLYASVRPHHVVALSVIDGGLRVVVPREGQTQEPLAAMLELRSTDNAPELGVSLQVIADALADQPAARRAAYIFTDGFSQTRIDAQPIIDAAKAGKVALNILVERSARPGDYASLKRIAEATGGTYAEGDAIKSVVDAPFAFLDSGATANVELGDLFYYPWEDGRDLAVTFSYGDKSLVLRAPVQARPATISEALSYLWTNFGREAAAITAAAGWAIALAGMAVGGIYRRRARLAQQADRDAEAMQEARRAEEDDGDSDAAGDIASLDGQTGSPGDLPQEDILPDDTASDGDEHSAGIDRENAAPPPRLSLRLFRPDGVTFVDVPLDGEQISIGRGDDNDIVLKEPTVSTRQALLVPDARGGYALQNLSETNPTRLDGEPMVRHELAGGEEVDLGGVRGVFVVADVADGNAAPFAAQLPLS